MKIERENLYMKVNELNLESNVMLSNQLKDQKLEIQ